MVCKGACMVNLKSGMADGMLIGMLLGAAYGVYQVYLVGMATLLEVSLVNKPPTFQRKDKKLRTMSLSNWKWMVYKSEGRTNTQKAAIDIADWSVHVAVVCALMGALLALAKGM